MHQKKGSCGNSVTMATANYANNFLISESIQMKVAWYMQWYTLNPCAKFKLIILWNKGATGIFPIAMVTRFHKTFNSLTEKFDTKRETYEI